MRHVHCICSKSDLLVHHSIHSVIAKAQRIITSYQAMTAEPATCGSEFTRLVSTLDYTISQLKEFLKSVVKVAVETKEKIPNQNFNEITLNDVVHSLDIGEKGVRKPIRLYHTELQRNVGMFPCSEN